MIDYATFSFAISALLVLLYGLLTVIALRWKRVFDRPVAIVGPVVTVLFAISILLFISSLTIGHPELGDLSRFVVALVRGMMAALGLYLVGWFLAAKGIWQG